MDVNLDNIPDDMKDAGYWVCWKYVERDGKPTKLPVDVNTGGNARTNDARTWATFAEAVAYAESHPDIEGLGFMFGREYTGIDIDHLDDWKAFPAKYDKLMKMIDLADTYVEYSPSGNGIHLLYKARKPQYEHTKCSTHIDPDYKNTHNDAAFEMWDNTRYFTVTGDKLDSSADYVSDSDAKVKDFYNEFLDDGMEKAKNAIASTMDDTFRKTDKRQVIRNAYHDKYSDKRFARVPRGLYTCDWCMMMASRGYVYFTESTAFAPGHTFCDCAIVPGFKYSSGVEGYDIDEIEEFYYKNLQEKYTSKEMYKKIDYWKKTYETRDHPGGGVVMTEDEYLKLLKDEREQAELNKMSRSSKNRLKARQNKSE